MTFTTRILLAGLFGLAALFAFWFAGRGWPALAWFCGLPLLVAAFNWTGGQKAAFWAGVCSLGWFSHGIMVAWSRPADRELALIEVALSLVVFAGATIPGFRARFSRK